MDKATLRLAFPEAIAYLRNKVPLPSKSWETYSGQLQDVAFTVAQITELSLLADIQALVVKQLEAGITIEGFKRDFGNLLDKAGYNLGNRGYRTELIIQQNVTTAYSRGRWEQHKQVRDRKPYLQWRHRDSRVPRPHHLAQDGKVYPADSEIFKAIFPPPFGCRCSAFALSDADLDRMGLKVSKPPALKDVAEPGFDQGFSELPKERDRLLKEAKKRLPPEFADQLSK
jgi:SPP1 gp7 family putative phage head morphogenesis protein